MGKTLRQQTFAERQARTLKENVGALKLVAEQAVERGDNGEEFTTISRIDLFTAINAGKEALRIIAVMEEKATDEAVREFRRDIGACVICGRRGAAMPGVEHDGWCWWCVRNRMEGKGIDSYGNPFPQEVL